MGKSAYIQAYKAFVYWFEHLDRRGWLIVLIVGMCLSFLCMRGARRTGT